MAAKRYMMQQHMIMMMCLTTAMALHAHSQLEADRFSADVIVRGDRLGWGERRAWGLGAQVNLLNPASPDANF